MDTFYYKVSQPAWPRLLQSTGLRYKSHHTHAILRAWGCDLFPTPSFICLSENYSKTIGGKLVGFSSVEDVDFSQCSLKSVSILVIDIFGVKNIQSLPCSAIQSRQTCKILRARGCDLFPTIQALFNFFVGKLVGNNWGKLLEFSSVKDVDFIQCILKSVSVFSYYYFWVKTLKSLPCSAIVQPKMRDFASQWL